MRDIALSLFVMGLIPFILMRPYIGLLVWSWFDYMSPHRLTYGFANNFPWVQLVAILTLVSLLISKESKSIAKSAVSILLLAFLLWTGFTTIFAIVPGAAWDKWIEFAKTLVMVFVTLILVSNRQRMHWLVWVIVVSLAFYGLKGGVFTLTHGGTSHVLGPPNTFIAGNNALALALCMVLPLIRYLQLQASRRYVRWGTGLTMLLTGVAVLGTYSRAGMVALAVVALGLILKSRHKLTIILAIAVLGYMAPQFMPAQWIARMETIKHARTVNTMQSRIESWKFAANVALHRPLRGGGFDVYKSLPTWRAFAPEGSVDRAVHSIFFRVLGEQGFPGLFIYVALLIAAWRCCSRVRRRTRRSPEQKWAFDLASMMQVSLVAYITAGLASPVSYFDFTFQLIAMCALLVEIVVATQTSSLPSTPAVTQTPSAPRSRVALNPLRAGRP